MRFKAGQVVTLTGKIFTTNRPKQVKNELGVVIRATNTFGQLDVLIQSHWRPVLINSYSAQLSEDQYGLLSEIPYRMLVAWMNHYCSDPKEIQDFLDRLKNKTE